MSAVPAVPVVVAVDPQRFAEVVQALRQAGMEVEAEHSAIGSVTGRVPEHRLPALQAVDGVVAVERERGYRIPPPESPIQ